MALTNILQINISRKNNITRKSFLKNFSATLGLITAGVPEILAAPKGNNSFYSNHSVESKTTGKIRGSWASNGKLIGDISLTDCEIICAKHENSAIQKAAQFLATDISKISAFKPAVLNVSTNNKVQIILSTVENSNLPKSINRAKLQHKNEAFQIVTDGNKVWVIGSDFRGTAFGVYTLSERLGIDPLYLWTGYQAIKNQTLALKKTDYFADSPTVTYRGFFHDDEDVLPRPFDKYGFPLRIGDVPLVWYQRFFETALRLKMNMVAPYVRVHRRYEVQKCASDWGLFFTSHHYDILLSNPFGIERFHLAERRRLPDQYRRPGK